MVIKMIKKIFTVIVLFFIISIGWGNKKANKYTYDISSSPSNIKYAGARSSSYGIKPFPQPSEWQQVMNKMTENFKGSAPCAIWIVGKLFRPKGCLLEFPSNGKRFKDIGFIKTDKHESYLDHFDKTGIKIFLQVEPGNADVETLIDLVLNRYKHHKCVIGFGIDVEWYREYDKPKWGVRVNDQSARSWEARVKRHNNNYQLFLKHWDRRWMPPKYRGDIIFVDDSQMFKNFNAMMREFVTYWADYFKPNTVFFQIGYPRDSIWWQKLNNPPKEIGIAIAQNISQDCGIFWVDFSLKKVFSIPNK